MTATARHRRAIQLLAAVGICLLAMGCATIPSSSRPQIIEETLPPSEPQSQGDLRYDAIVPRAGERPEDVVRDFLRVGGSYERDHARARAYLTRPGSDGWKDDSRVTLLEDAPYLEVQGGGSRVLMRGQQQGRVEADGSYVAGRARYPYAFRLKKVNGNWRIDNPPSGVLIEAGTFDAAFRAYNIYFLDGTRTRVVPDVRWFAAARDALPSVLVTAIQQGPSAWLSGAVRSDLEDTTLQSNVEQESDRVKVYLTGLGEGADTLPSGGFAQLVWTLNQLGVGGVEVYVDGRLVGPREAPGRSPQRLSDWRGFDPDGLSVSTPGYFVKNGAVWTTEDAPLAGPAGRSSYGATAVALSTNRRSLAVLRRAAGGGRTLFVGSVTALRPRITGTSLTAPTWASTVSEVWTVQNGHDVVLVPSSGGATRVVAALDKIGPVRALRLSRDGSRVAVVAGAPGRERLHVGVVIRDNNASVRIAGLKELDVGEEPVSDVSWSDALTLVALARAGEQDSALYAVGIDGLSGSRLVSTSGLPGPPSAVAAAPALPLLAVSANSLWRTPAADEKWTPVSQRLGPDSAPAYPG
ncbi:MAG: LpqB family beta-propeller domain-containing protein [Mycobacteriales bacterium]